MINEITAVIAVIIAAIIPIAGIIRYMYRSRPKVSIQSRRFRENGNNLMFSLGLDLVIKNISDDQFILQQIRAPFHLEGQNDQHELLYIGNNDPSLTPREERSYPLGYANEIPRPITNNRVVIDYIEVRFSNGGTQRLDGYFHQLRR